MRYEELITELCEVIKETENDAQGIFDSSQDIEDLISDIDMPRHKKQRLEDTLSNIYGFLQRQDLHRQKIERVVNFVCDKNDIDKSQYNLAPSAKTINPTEDSLNEEELEALIKSMQ
ncbi:hypothetical protein CRU87_06600 [Aliarcobacter trophiarum LMG 25534]|uniref:Uncharacterized protein n=1 Tax=Aliarcobacter trophiarum LMG 25534 TaxID=1032241 RepID=A0AAD0VM82_9BACT|nr:hypothetical protein [Aliarcobacter trophiarum]AXK48615.1 hypothetical protein ATR_0746 [Aliarcobacter trophiarum LMG 25534]RXI27670.1 hypothetical protein CRU89_05175 [Aliarcobacter trophiarum]RXJ91054.1 hypothetical protein CRU87_06600 [Aliarcobacter trophiarum LMG 25534]